MAERLLQVPRTTKAGIGEISHPIIVNDCNFSDLDELFIDLPLVGTVIIVDQSDRGYPAHYVLGYHATVTPANAVAITDRTGYYWQLMDGRRVAVTKTADYTVTDADLGQYLTNTGAAGTITFALPAATVGMIVRARVSVAQQLRLDPNGTETISLPSTGVPGAAGKYLVADAIGETVVLECVVAGTWSCFGYTGTWTAEA